MTVTISRLYDNYGAARAAVRALENAGVPHNDISILASNAETGTLKIKGTLIQIGIWTGR